MPWYRLHSHCRALGTYAGCSPQLLLVLQWGTECEIRPVANFSDGGFYMPVCMSVSTDSSADDASHSGVSADSALPVLLED